MQTPLLTVTFADGSATANVNQSLSAESLVKLEASIPAESSNKDVALACDISQIQALLIHSTTAMTVATRSGAGADVDVLTLAAGKPILWQAGCGIALSALFTADFVALQVDAVAAAVLTIWILSDATP